MQGWNDQSAIICIAPYTCAVRDRPTLWIGHKASVEGRKRFKVQNI